MAIPEFFRIWLWTAGGGGPHPKGIAENVFSLENFFLFSVTCTIFVFCGLGGGGGGARTHREFRKHFFLRKFFSILWHFHNFFVYGLGRRVGGGSNTW